MIMKKKCFAFMHVLHLFSSLWKYADAADFSVYSWIAGVLFHDKIIKQNLFVNFYSTLIFKPMEVR